MSRAIEDGSSIIRNMVYSSVFMKILSHKQIVLFYDPTPALQEKCTKTLHENLSIIKRRIVQWSLWIGQNEYLRFEFQTKISEFIFEIKDTVRMPKRQPWCGCQRDNPCKFLFSRLNEEKQLIASLLSGTFKPPVLKKNVPHIRGISEPAYTQSTWEKTTTWPRAGKFFCRGSHFDPDCFDSLSKMTEYRGGQSTVD